MTCEVITITGGHNRKAGDLCGEAAEWNTIHKRFVCWVHVHAIRELHFRDDRPPCVPVAK